MTWGENPQRATTGANVMTRSEQTISFTHWGKASQDAAWHPLQAHSLDVAAVAVEAWERWPALSALFVARLGLPQGTLGRWLAFWMSLHDLGKYAEAFQSQRRDLFVACRGRTPDPAKPYVVRHDSLGMLFWRDVLREQVIDERWFGPDSEDLVDACDAWMRACAGHHGQPPLLTGTWRLHFDASFDRNAALQHVHSMRQMLLSPSDLGAIQGCDPGTLLAASQELSWWIAGLAVLADWLGSNRSHFPYLSEGEPAFDIRAYWGLARERAQAALAASGVLPPRTSPSMSFAQLFPAIAAASPLQRWACEAPLPGAPQVHILEDVTGAGKTEAALMLTHRLMAAGVADGFYVALPTMATANAMYARVAHSYAALFEDPASLVLATGARDLVDAFAASVVEDLAAAVLPRSEPEGDAAQLDETASARCAAWLADHRKRALLSPAGVGTIDQALLAVLHSKHQSLRLLGLLHKVLLVDEVHACDDYMLKVLQVLLTFHARAGGSAVLLSATLPRRSRQLLLDAFAAGRRLAAPAADQQAYPLVTSWPGVDGGQAAQVSVDTRPDVRRRVSVQCHERPEDVLALIRAALSAGQCVCWVRNTVADAVAAFDGLQAELPPDRLTLFHARFALHDRLAAEQRVLAAFGPSSGPAERNGRLLIATQVVEQSLDVDFDVLISDLAPVDRLLQRAGRLRRHRRRTDGTAQAVPSAPDERGEPRLHLLCPPWTNTPSADWFKARFPKAAAVYPNHAQSWLTMRLLRVGDFTMPDDARRLIEGVFGEEAHAPPGLESSALAAEGQGFAAQAQAMTNTLKLDLGYSREQSGGADWWSDAHTPSRLGDATATVALAQWDGVKLRPWVDRPHGWSYSSLRMAERSIAATASPADPTLAGAVESACQELPAQGRWTVLLPLRQTAEGWVGEALSGPDKNGVRRLRRWRYDPRRGLEAWPPAVARSSNPDEREDIDA